MWLLISKICESIEHIRTFSNTSHQTEASHALVFPLEISKAILCLKYFHLHENLRSVTWHANHQYQTELLCSSMAASRWSCKNSSQQNRKSRAPWDCTCVQRGVSVHWWHTALSLCSSSSCMLNLCPAGIPERYLQKEVSELFHPVSREKWKPYYWVKPCLYSWFAMIAAFAAKQRSFVVTPWAPGL